MTLSNRYDIVEIIGLITLSFEWATSLNNMAEPLSFSAGVVGVLTAAVQISSLLIEFTRSSKDAPQAARAVLAEVNDISGTLSHIQSYLLKDERSDKSREQLLQLDHVIKITSGCVLTFSELEKLLDGLKADGMGLLDRAHWARKEKQINKIIQRLQNHKASLSLIFNVFNEYADIDDVMMMSCC